MKTYNTDSIRNVVLLGNAGSGKTTLAEAMLYEGKVIERRGSIDAKNTVSDCTEIEQNYQRSIYSTVLFTEFMDCKLNLIDTPGSDDFCGGVFSAFQVADTGVMVINAQQGVEVGTEIFARYAADHNKPLIFVMNQLDHEKANYESAMESLKTSFGSKVVSVQYPLVTGPSFDGFVDLLLMKYYRFKGDSGVREELAIPDSEADKVEELRSLLMEAAAEHDEALMEIFFDKGSLTTEEIRKGLSIGVKAGAVYPAFCASAKKDIGTKRIMEFLINVAPNPAQGNKYTTIEGEEIPCNAAASPALFVFKNAVEQHLGEVSYFRVISGKISEGLDMINTTNDGKERLTQLFSVAGKKKEKVTELVAGDIGCAVKLKNTRTNHTLAVGKNWKFPKIKFPNPKFRTAIKPLKESDSEKLGELLNRAHQEDPTILVEYSKELKQIILQGQGEHHLNILKWTLSNLNKIDVEFVVPRISYRETITKIASADYRHRKQSGGAGQFGEVHMLIEPYIEGAPENNRFKVDGKELVLNLKAKEEFTLDWGGKLVYYNCIVGGAIDARFMPAILKGVMEKMEEGPLTGSYARDIKVFVYDGKMHPVDSNELSFMLAGRNAFRTAFKNAGPKIMEPIYAVEVMVPSDYMGDVMSDLQGRRAMIEGMSTDRGFQILKARVPLAEMYKYSTTLSSLTSGRATYEMSFLEFQQVPSDVQDKLLKAYEAENADD